MPRHHTVPQMYLRNFADDRNLLSLVDRDDKTRMVASSVKNACNEVGFYHWDTGLTSGDVDDPAILDPEYIEGLLSVFENRASAEIEEILATGGPPSTTEGRYHLTNFIALQSTRGPGFRKELSQAATARMRLEVLSDVRREGGAQAWLAARGMVLSPAGADAFIEEAFGSGGPLLVPGDAHAIQGALDLAMNHVGPQLFRGQWTVLVTTEPAMITSDEPVVVYDPDGDPVGVANAPVVWMPLGRRHLLEITADRLREPVAHSVGGVGVVNALVATRAHRWIIHHPDDAHLLSRIDIGPRTTWGPEILERHFEGDTIREAGRLRRLPIEELDPKSERTRNIQ